MKPGTIVIVMIAILLTGCSASSSTARKEKAAADFQKTVELIESGNYRFTLRSASPSGGKTIQITSQYTMDVKEGNYEAYLPYFGRAYSASYGGDGGVEFKGEPENLLIERDDQKNSINISFTIKSSKGNDSYDVSLKVGNSGFGNMTINSRNRQAISYYGILGPLED